MRALFSGEQLSWQEVYYHFIAWGKQGTWQNLWLKRLSLNRRTLDLSSVQFNSSHPLVKNGWTAKSIQIIEQINAYITTSQEQERAKAVLAAAAPQVFSVADGLSKLAGLKQQGILTEQAFQEQKQRFLTR